MSELIPPGDTIFLRGLAIECIIGFIDWERRVKQTVVIDLELQSVACTGSQTRADPDIISTQRLREVFDTRFGVVRSEAFRMIGDERKRVGLQ